MVTRGDRDKERKGKERKGKKPSVLYLLTDHESGQGVRRVQEAGGRVDAAELLELARVGGLGGGERGWSCQGLRRRRRCCRRRLSSPLRRIVVVSVRCCRRHLSAASVPRFAPRGWSHDRVFFLSQLRRD